MQLGWLPAKYINMSQLLKYREDLALTQEQLSLMSNISVRTIQRIEAGNAPKGHTLEALSLALGIDQEKLIAPLNSEKKVDVYWLKLINLSSLLLLLLPLGSIVLPLIIMFWKKEVNAITKQLITIQVLWTLSFPMVVFTVMFIGKWLGLSNQIVPLTMLFMLVLNMYIILRNAVELQSTNKLYISPNFSVL